MKTKSYNYNKDEALTNSDFNDGKLSKRIIKDVVVQTEFSCLAEELDILAKIYNSDFTLLDSLADDDVRFFVNSLSIDTMLTLERFLSINS